MAISSGGMGFGASRPGISDRAKYKKPKKGTKTVTMKKKRKKRKPKY